MTPDDRMCDYCGNPISPAAKRFCSYNCWCDWQRVQPRSSSSPRRKRAYDRWFRMMERCYGEGSHRWSRYGGRGITVCDEWHDFDTYYADTGDAPPGLTLDRIDNEGPYSPENTRWATAKQQRANQEYDHMRVKTHCKNGHPFDEENTHIDSRGWRSCRACSRAKRRRQRAQRKGVA